METYKLQQEQDWTFQPKINNLPDGEEACKSKYSN